MSDEVSLRDFSALIGSIYDCTLDPSRWDATLADIAAAFEGEVLNLSLNDFGRDRLLIEKSVGWGPKWLAERQKHLPEIHARLNEWLGRRPSLDDPFVASRHLDRSYLETSAYVRDCLRPRGIADIMHYILMATPTHFSELVVGLDVRRGTITDREIAIGKLLLPHLRRAVTISNLLDLRAIEKARLAETLDALRCGVVLTDEKGAMLHANQSAEEMLRSGEAIQAVGGMLRAREPAAAKELSAAIRIAAEDETKIGRADLAIRLSEPESPSEFAYVLPISGGELRTNLRPAAVAAVFIGTAPQERDGADAMAGVYGLTPAETRVLASLLAGRTVAETAAFLGIAATTVKSHLESIFLKTGISRQADLMRRATQMSPLVRLPAS